MIAWWINFTLPDPHRFAIRKEMEIKRKVQMWIIFMNDLLCPYFNLIITTTGTFCALPLPRILASLALRGFPFGKIFKCF